MLNFVGQTKKKYRSGWKNDRSKFRAKDALSNVHRDTRAHTQTEIKGRAGSQAQTGEAKVKECAAYHAHVKRVLCDKHTDTHTEQRTKGNNSFLIDAFFLHYFVDQINWIKRVINSILIT